MRARTAVAALAGGLVVTVLAFAAPSLVALADSEVDRTLGDPAITESSGLAVSAKHPGVVYTHNDSLDGPRVFAVGRDGGTEAVLTLSGAEARDWEGMSTGPGETLWVGDIGDNIDGWFSYRIYRFTEPAELADRDVKWTQYDFQFADGEARNAETLMVHPVTGRVYIATKEVMGAALYAGPEKLSTSSPNLLTRVSRTLPFATDGAFSPTGELFVVRGYVDAKVYRTSQPGKAIATVDLPAQRQGESIAWGEDGTFLYAGSEGGDSKVYRVDLPANVTAISAPASLSPSASSTASADPSSAADPTTDPAGTDGGGGLPRAQVWWLAAGAVVLIVLGLSLRSWSKRDP